MRTIVVHAKQIGVHETPLCALLVLEILCPSTKLTFVLMLSAWWAFHVFGCDLSVYHLRSHVWILGSWVFTLSLRCYRALCELLMVSNHPIVNTNISWTHASTNLLVDATIFTLVKCKQSPSWNVLFAALKPEQTWPLVADASFNAWWRHVMETPSALVRGTTGGFLSPMASYAN